MLKAELVCEAQAGLGEGPAWFPREACLYWVDIHAGSLHAFNPASGSDQVHSFPAPLSCVVPLGSAFEKGHSLLAAAGEIVLVNKLPGECKTLARPEKHLPGNRFNDGKCGPGGRFLIGTMDNLEKEASGSLYSYSPDGSIKTLLTGLRISNGLTWSPDGRIFYFIDTPTRQVTAFDYDLETGNIFNPRTAVTIPSNMGWPDGMTADSQGRLWVAMWGGACLTCWDPNHGELIERVPIPALQATSCTFGGEGLRDLYITSARKGLSAAQLDDYPLSGGLFRVRMDVPGVQLVGFGGS